MRRRRTWAAVAAGLVIGALLAVGQSLVSSTVAGAAVGPFSKAEVNLPAGTVLNSGGATVMKFNTVEAGGNNASISLVLKSPAGTPADWVLDLEPPTGGAFTVSDTTYVDSRITQDATHMRAFLHQASQLAPTTGCGEQFGRVRIRSLDATPTVLNSIAVDFEFQCGVSALGGPTGPMITGWVAYHMPIGPITPPTGDGEFVPVAPFRVLDTRNTTPLGTNETRPITIGSPVPTDAVAVVLNVTAINPTEWGYLTVFATGGTQPFVSNMNFKPLQTVPNAVVVKMGTANQVSIFNPTGSTHIAVDVMGYFAPSVQAQAAGGRYTPVVPTRVLDTRGFGPFSDEYRQVAVRVPGDPTNVKSLVLNVTVADAQRGGFLGVTPGGPAPTNPTSNLNFNPGDTVPNLVMVGAPQSGTPGTYLVGITVGGSADVIIDVVGAFNTDRSTEAGRFVPIDPKRIVDSRSAGAGGPLGPTASRELETVRVLDHYSVEVSGLVFNGTGANATAPTYLTFWPADVERPLASNLNLNAGDTRANLVISGDDPYGYAKAFNAAGSVDVIADAAGWFTR